MSSRRYSNYVKRGSEVHIPDECVTASSGRSVAASQRKKTIVILNPGQRHIRKVKVDGCVITDSTTPRCDYLFEVGEPLVQALYVELKGNDLERACEQLSHTVRLFSRRHGKVPRRCFVVASRVPGASTGSQVLMAKFFRDNKVHVRFKSRLQKITV